MNRVHVTLACAAALAFAPTAVMAQSAVETTAPELKWTPCGDDAGRDCPDYGYLNNYAMGLLNPGAVIKTMTGKDGRSMDGFAEWAAIEDSEQGHFDGNTAWIGNTSANPNAFPASHPSERIWATQDQNLLLTAVQTNGRQAPNHTFTDDYLWAIWKLKSMNYKFMGISATIDSGATTAERDRIQQELITMAQTCKDSCIFVDSVMWSVFDDSDKLYADACARNEKLADAGLFVVGVRPVGKPMTGKTRQSPAETYGQATIMDPAKLGKIIQVNALTHSFALPAAAWTGGMVRWASNQTYSPAQTFKALKAGTPYLDAVAAINYAKTH